MISGCLNPTNEGEGSREGGEVLDLTHRTADIFMEDLFFFFFSRAPRLSGPGSDIDFVLLSRLSRSREPSEIF